MLLRTVLSLEEITCIRNWKLAVQCLLRLPNSSLGKEKQMTHIEDILLQTSTFVLACGRGARLTPLTHKRSKPAVPFGDRRIIDFVLANCLRSNLKHPSVITQYQGAHLTQHVGRWWLEQSASGAAATASPVCVPCPSQ